MEETQLLMLGSVREGFTRQGDLLNNNEKGKRMNIAGIFWK